MMEPIEGAPREREDELHHVIKTDPDPRVRRRAQALLWVAQDHSQASAARRLQTGRIGSTSGSTALTLRGRAGLVDRPRGGRPHALSEADRALLQREPAVTVSVDTVHRAVQAIGYRYRRPRHESTPRQDRAAVDAARHMLEWLQKNQRLSPQDSIWSTWTSVQSLRPPTRAMVWRRKGQPLKVPAAGEDHKAIVFGAVDYASGHVLWPTCPRKGEVAFTAFLDHLAQTLPASEPVVLVLGQRWLPQEPWAT